MAIKLAQVPEVERSVEVAEPTATGGHRKSKIRVTYKLLSVEEYRRTAEQQAEDPDSLTDYDVMHRDVTHVKDVKDEDGKDVEFTPDLLTALLNRNDTRSAIIRGWQEVQTNHEAHAAKN